MTARFSSIPGGDSAAMRARNPALYSADVCDKERKPLPTASVCAPQTTDTAQTQPKPCTDTPAKRKRRGAAYSTPERTPGGWDGMVAYHQELDAAGAELAAAKKPTRPTNARLIREYGVPKGKFIVSMLDATKEGE